MIDKIYIVGPVGSGKSTLARKISSDYDFTYGELDTIVYKPDPTSPNGNRKRDETDRDRLISEILSSKRWIIEDSGRETFEYLWRDADSIIFLEPSVSVRKFRIILRWIKQKMHLEKCSYRPGFYMVKAMFKWTKNFEDGTDNLKERLTRYNDKVVHLRSNRDIRRYIEHTFTA